MEHLSCVSVSVSVSVQVGTPYFQIWISLNQIFDGIKYNIKYKFAKYEQMAHMTLMAAT